MPPPQTLTELTSKPYYDQAKWYLNGFWEQGGKDQAEKVWQVTSKFIELDPQKQAGNELDEFNAHKLLESQGQTLTVIELRNVLKAIDMDKNGKFALLEYLLHTFGRTVEQCLNSPQGSDTQRDEINKAAEKLKVVQEKLAEVQNQVAAQTKALADQKAAEDAASKGSEASTKASQQAESDKAAAVKAAESAKAQLDAQKKAEELIKTSEADLKAAIDEIKKQEDDHAAKIKELTEKSNEAGLSTIQRSKAAAELATAKGQDNSSLRKAKASQETVLKKITKERQEAEEKTGSAKEAHEAAEKAAKQATDSAKAADDAKSAASGSAGAAAQKRKELEEQTKKVEAAKAETEKAAAEAHAFLEEQKNKSAVAHGAIWWMEREIEETKKFMPKKNLQYEDK